MDPEAFLDLANQVTKLKMYPYFELAHAAMCLIAVREELGAGKAKKDQSWAFTIFTHHPDQSWVFEALKIC